MYNKPLFKLIKIEIDCMKDKVLPYKLIGDYAYLVWPWIYNPFKSCLDVYKVMKLNWNLNSNFYSHVRRTCF